jgi:hypothetical protein
MPVTESSCKTLEFEGFRLTDGLLVELVAELDEVDEDVDTDDELVLTEELEVDTTDDVGEEVLLLTDEELLVVVVVAVDFEVKTTAAAAAITITMITTTAATTLLIPRPFFPSISFKGSSGIRRNSPSS